MERLGWHARYIQTNVSMAVQDGDNVGRYVNVPGIVIGIEFSLPPTCVNPNGVGGDEALVDGVVEHHGYPR